MPASVKARVTRCDLFERHAFLHELQQPFGCDLRRPRSQCTRCPRCSRHRLGVTIFQARLPHHEIGHVRCPVRGERLSALADGFRPRSESRLASFVDDGLDAIGQGGRGTLRNARCSRGSVAEAAFLPIAAMATVSLFQRPSTKAMHRVEHVRATDSRERRPPVACPRRQSHVASPRLRLM